MLSLHSNRRHAMTKAIYKIYTLALCSCQRGIQSLQAAAKTATPKVFLPEACSECHGASVHHVPTSNSLLLIP